MEGTYYSTQLWQHPEEIDFFNSYRAKKAHGQGVMRWIEGDKYEGEWADGYRHGKGVYTSKVINSRVTLTSLEMLLATHTDLLTIHIEVNKLRSYLHKKRC